MSASTRSIDVLLKEVTDPSLRGRLTEAIKALRKRTRFGLVFEGHHPEVSRLPDVPVRKGGLVARRSEKGNALYRVSSITGTSVVCVPEESPTTEVAGNDDLFARVLTIPLADLVAARRFGEAIYPSLKLIDTVQHGSEKPWHQLIQADNYHALQALNYTHAGKIDVIYLDPPYNTGARDWRYNNDYVDLNDPFRHSKWLSFMEKRLRLAKKLLKTDGAMIITIDEHEAHHLGCLLEQIFPDAKLQMVTIVNNAAGVSQGGFYRVEEYAFFVFTGIAKPVPGHDDLLSETISGAETSFWFSLIRYGGVDALPSKRKGMVYPVAIDPETKRIVATGRTLADMVKSGEVTGDVDKWVPPKNLKLDGYPVVWPFRGQGALCRWQLGPETLLELSKKGYVRVREQAKGPGGNKWSISYIKSGTQAKVEKGEIAIEGREENGGALILGSSKRHVVAKTVWRRAKHDAGKWGSRTLREILGSVAFDYAKSPYAVWDTLGTLLRDKKESIVVDFFAGSGTTLHAICLMNAADTGSRQCILITNNEVSDSERKRLFTKGYKEGNPEWEEHGICKAVTWPRCKYVIQGQRDDGTVLRGEYVSGKIEEQEVRRLVAQLDFAEGATLDLAGRKSVARLVDGIAVGVVSASDPWHLEAEGTASILWDISKAEAWIDVLSDSSQVASLYVVTRQKAAFNKLAEEINGALPPLILEREITRPMSAGFEENLAYLELGFLDPSDVARGQQFAAILPLLWMLTGARAECPKPGSIRKWLISPECGFAVLHDEKRFVEFYMELKDIKDILHVFLVTDSEDTFKEMRTGFRKGTRTHKLYSSYLQNFGINVRPAS